MNCTAYTCFSSESTRLLKLFDPAGKRRYAHEQLNDEHELLEGLELKFLTWPVKFNMCLQHDPAKKLANASTT